LHKAGENLNKIAEQVTAFPLTTGQSAGVLL